MAPLIEKRFELIPTAPGSDWRDLPNAVGIFYLFLCMLDHLVTGTHVAVAIASMHALVHLIDIFAYR
jgi:hypothetical protein